MLCGCAGCLAYGAVAFIAGRQSMQEATRSHQSLADGDRARYAVLAGSTALATTSGYLLYLLATVFRGETCVWCLTSAALSLTTFASAMRGFTMRWGPFSSKTVEELWSHDHILKSCVMGGGKIGCSRVACITHAMIPCTGVCVEDCYAL